MLQQSIKFKTKKNCTSKNNKTLTVCAMLCGWWCCGTWIWICQWSCLRTRNEFGTRWFCTNSCWIFGRFSTAAIYQINLHNRIKRNKKKNNDIVSISSLNEFVFWYIYRFTLWKSHINSIFTIIKLMETKKISHVLNMLFSFIEKHS